MSDVFVATIGGVIALIFWGTTDWLSARSSKKYSSYEVTLAVQIPAMVIMSIVLLVSNVKLPSPEQTVPIVASTVFLTAAFVFFTKALASGSVGIVVPLGATNPLITLILSVVFEGRVFAIAQISSMLCILAGVILLAYQKNIDKIPVRVLHRETFFALMAALCWGTGFFLIDTIVADQPWQIVLGIVDILMTILAILLILFVFKSKSFSKIKGSFRNKTGLYAGLCATIGSIGFFSSSEYVGSVLVVAFIASANPLIASALSAKFDKESLNYVKRLGAGLAVAGIILLNVV